MMIVPWQEFFMTTTPSGGDNPAHPYLMASVRDAFIKHGSIVHYANGYWSGFELFQFYFPLPYLTFGLLSLFIHPSIAFKAMVLLPLLLLPWAFTRLARSFDASLWVQATMSLLSFTFLFTEAHVMWGGNIFSLSAGMIGNQWAVFFLIWSFALSVDAYNQRKFSLPLILTSVATGLCHFYALLMLIAVGAGLVMWVLITEAPWDKNIKKWKFFANFILAAFLCSWWFIPLFYYRPWSTDFGGAWDINLIDTFTRPEKIFFTLGLISTLVLFFIPKKRFFAFMIGSFFVINILLYYFGKIFGIHVLLDVRIWPAIYLALYFSLLSFSFVLEKIMPAWVKWAPVVIFYILLPNKFSLEKARFWFTWNWAGMESKEGWDDYKNILDILKKAERVRIITEMSEPLDKYLGSVRSFELIPYLIPNAEIPIGGIVNSATYSHVGYAFQCMVGEGCAGMPPGVTTSNVDPKRAVQMMKVTGTNFALIMSPQYRYQFKAIPELEEVYSSSRFSLFHLIKRTNLVEIYDSKLPLLCSKRYLTTAVNLHRWDILRDTAMEFKNNCTAEEEKSSVSTASFFNYLVDNWKTDKTAMDRGWQDRKDRLNSELKGVLFSFRSPIGSGKYLTDLFEPVIGYRNFDSELATSNLNHLDSEVIMPLQKIPPGPTSLVAHVTGYTIYLNGEAIPSSMPIYRTISQNELLFKPIPFARFRTIDVQSSDPNLKSRLLADPLSIDWPKKDPSCDAEVKVDFHRIELQTSCPGKPHVIKYSYYPKWKADVPISISTNGYMTLTPKNHITILKHRAGIADWIGYLTTIVGFLGCFALIFHQRRDKSGR